MIPLHRVVYWRFFSLVVLGGFLFLFCISVSRSSFRGPTWRPLSDSQNVDILQPDVQESNNTSQMSTTFESSGSKAINKILEDLIIENANNSYHPDRYKDLDLTEFTRQTTIFKELWNIYESFPPSEYDSISTRTDRLALHDALDTLQKILFPWITSRKPNEPGVESLFSLVDSFRQDAGLVITTGKKGFRWTIHQVSTLRNVLKCPLPIEVFYAGDNDLPLEHRQALESISHNSSVGGSIRTVDIKSFFPDPDGVMDMPGGWALRPFAVLASSFQKVILTDADTVFIQDPTLLLQEQGFKDTGAIFYHDRLLAPAKDEVYDWVDNILEEVNAKRLDDVKKNSGWFSRKTFYEMESGALAIDKTRNLAAVLMICHLNLKAQRNAITYKKFYGDKESYWMGHALTSTPYYFVPGYSGGIGRISKKAQKKPSEIQRLTDEERSKYLESLETSQEVVCTLQILHILESNGQPFWFNNGLTEYKGDNNDQYLHAEGWVGHDGHWGGGPTRFPNELCIEPVEGEFDRLLGDQKPKRLVTRISGGIAEIIQGLIQEAQRWDRICEDLGLFQVKKGS